MAVLARDERSDSAAVVANDFETYEIRLDFAAPICLHFPYCVLPTLVHYPVQYYIILFDIINIHFKHESCLNNLK